MIPKLDIPRARPSRGKLLSAARGLDRRISQSTALHLLSLRPEIKQRYREFQTVLENTRQPPIVRYWAALYLGKIDSPETVAVLKRNLASIDDDVVLGAVLRSLGRIGDRESLDRIEASQGKYSSSAAGEAGFAATLLAHRHGVAGYEVGAGERYLSMQRNRSRGLIFKPATSADKRAVIGSLAAEPLGMQIARDKIYRLQCGPRVMLIVFNPQVIEAADLRGPFRSCRLVGAILDRHGPTEAYAPVYFMLSCPKTEKRAQVTLHNHNGRALFAGTVTVAEKTLRFSFRGLRTFGVVPLDVTGTLARGRLAFGRRRVGTRVRQKRAAGK